MPEYTIKLTDEQDAILAVRGTGQTVGEYLQAVCVGKAEEFHTEYEVAVKQASMEKIQRAAEIPELKADYEALVKKVDDAVAAEEAAKLVEEEPSEEPVKG
jgi:hypothetical protein